MIARLRVDGGIAGELDRTILRYSNGARAGFVRRGIIEAGFVQGEGYRRARL